MSQKNYLPIGSVVLLKEGKKRLMIYGRRQLVKDGEKEYDYSACKDVVLFNHDQIQMIYFIGFQDIEELHFRSLLKNSGE